MCRVEHDLNLIKEKNKFHSYATENRREIFCGYLAFLGSGPHSLLHSYPPEVFNSKAFLFACLYAGKDDVYFSELPEIIQKDPEVMKTVAIYAPSLFKGSSVNPHLFDKEFMLEIVSENGVALCIASHQLKLDSDILKAATKKYPEALAFALTGQTKTEKKEIIISALKCLDINLPVLRDRIFKYNFSDDEEIRNIVIAKLGRVKALKYLNKDLPSEILFEEPFEYSSDEENEDFAAAGEVEDEYEEEILAWFGATREGEG